MNREFLMLAKDFKDHHLDSYLWSIKIDGQRAFWDGGISRGQPAKDVAWCNTLKSGGVATGLYSRYGKVIFAPDWWLDTLPPWPLDGELYLGKSSRAELRSIVSRRVADDRWGGVLFWVFDSPPLGSVFMDGDLRNPNWKTTFKDIKYNGNTLPRTTHFFSALEFLRELDLGTYGRLLPQSELPAPCLDDIPDEEGIMYRSKYSLWQPLRVNTLLKHKLFNDAEGLIVGYTWGEGKFEGLMGSLLVLWNSHILRIGGFTDSERILVTFEGGSAFRFCDCGSDVQPGIYNKMFQCGESVTFKYWGLSADGIPQSAQYYR